MTSSKLYKVMNLKGKGLGCVASKNIEKGALILSENPQIRGRISEELKDETKWIKTLVQSFNRMNKADQIDYLALHSKYDDIQTLPPDFKEHVEAELNNLKSKIESIEGDPECAKKILKIYNIYSSNSFMSGVRIKTSRFNHSCQPNAATVRMFNGQHQVRAISNIEAGEEININYHETPYFGLRNRKFRKASLLFKWFFTCSCQLCEDKAVDNSGALEELIQEAEKYTKDRHAALEVGQNFGHLYYSLETCRKEISCYKLMYNKIGKHHQVQYLFMFKILNRAFDTATMGYQLHKAADLKIDAENFAKSAENCGHFLGYEFVTRGNPNYWKQRYQDFEKWLSSVGTLQ